MRLTLVFTASSQASGDDRPLRQPTFERTNDNNPVRLIDGIEVRSAGSGLPVVVDARGDGSATGMAQDKHERAAPAVDRHLDRPQLCLAGHTPRDPDDEQTAEGLVEHDLRGGPAVGAGQDDRVGVGHAEGRRRRRGVRGLAYRLDESQIALLQAFEGGLTRSSTTMNLASILLGVKMPAGFARSGAPSEEYPAGRGELEAAGCADRAALSGRPPASGHPSPRESRP